MPKQNNATIRIIACQVFQTALESLHLESRFPDVCITYLPSTLHLKPQALQKRLDIEVASAKEKDERIICLYGTCTPDIDGFCERNKVKKVPGHYCYEMLLGTKQFKDFLDQTAGTYFAEKDLIENFNDYCIKPLELHDEEMRNLCFKHYSKLVYIRQPADPELTPRAGEIADFLDLSLDISDADYTYLDKTLTELLQNLQKD